MTLKAPFPYFGGKSTIAHLVWERFGRVNNYVEPFFGSGAVLLKRRHRSASRRSTMLTGWYATSGVPWLKTPRAWRSMPTGR